MSGASSNDVPRITNGDMVTSPIESSETLSSLGESTLECSVSSFEVVRQPCGSTDSLVSSFTLVEADPEGLEPGSGTPLLDATPIPTEEEEFLASMCGDTDEFGVRLCCPYIPGCPLVHATLVPQIPPIGRHRPQGES
jgi:hypothetical protein